MNKNLIVLVILFITTGLFANEPIEVADLTIKIGIKKAETLYYAFAEGDEIEFSFKETSGKGLKEVEIFEYPDNVKYQDYKTTSIEKKRIKVQKRGIYKFRFYNSSLKKKICKINIRRIPVNPENLNFNTAIEWAEVFDTTYSIKTETITVGYDTIQKQKSRRVLATVDTTVVSVMDRMERVHSSTNLSNSNTSSIVINLPENTYAPHQFAPYKSSEVIAWAYAITSGGSGKQWYQNANAKVAVKTGTSMAVKAGLISSGYGALGLLALEGYSAFSNPPSGDNVNFQIAASVNGILRSFGKGNSVAASGRITDCTQGSFNLYHTNDNLMNGINVDVKVVAIVVNKTWKKENYTVDKQEAIREKQTKKIPKVSVKKIPVMVGNG